MRVHWFRTLQPDESAKTLAEVLLVEWSRRADAFTLLLEACAGSEQVPLQDCMVLRGEHSACAVSKMYALMMTAPALQEVVGRTPDHLQKCIDEALNARPEEKGLFGHRSLLLVLADCALRCESRNAELFERAANALCEKVGFDDAYGESAFRGIWASNYTRADFRIFDQLYGCEADANFRVMFSLLISRPSPTRSAEVVQYLCGVFWQEWHDELLQAVIFKSKFSPLPRKSPEDMTEDERNQWQEDFSFWLRDLRERLQDGGLLFRFSRLLLSHLIDVKASPMTMSVVLTEIERARADYEAALADAPATREEFGKFRKAKKRAEGKEQKKTENLQTAVAPPELLHALRRGVKVKSLTEVGDDEATLAETIGNLVKEGLLEGELQILLSAGLGHDKRDGIARPNLLRALLFRAGLFDGHWQPSLKLLAQLGRRCCAWNASGSQSSGKEFVNYLGEELSKWTTDQWATVDAEFLAAFMSGVLESTLDHLDQEPLKRIEKIGSYVTKLIRLSDPLVHERFGERFDSPGVKRCLELLQLLRGRPGVQV